jgi:hypothetical protein
MGVGQAGGRALAGVGLSVLALGPGAQASPGHHLPCPRRGAEVVASDKLVRVYSYPPTKERFAPPRRTEACVIGRGIRMTLFDPELHTGVRFRTFAVVALASTVVAYSISSHGIDTGTSSVFLADIASRRILRELPGGGFIDAGFISRTRITGFVLDASGSAAWIDEVGGGRRATTFVVRSAPTGHEEVVLDEGSDIAPNSLQLSSGTLSWLDAGMRRTARLTP